MLKELREHYACASCNDFNLADLFPDRSMGHEIMKRVDPLAYDPNDDYVVVSDGQLLAYLYPLV